MTGLSHQAVPVRAAGRRVLFFAPVLATTAAGVALMAQVLGTNDFSTMEAAILVVFAASFGWISLSFWAALFGLALQAARRDPVTLARVDGAGDGPLPTLRTRMAIVMPVYNEDPQRVFAGLAATYRSLEATGQLAQFDVFVLSDTTDAAAGLAEEAAWQQACRDLGAGGRLFYRRRAENRGRKAGNIAEWVTGWGGAYEGMLVLDADSVMAGPTILRLAAALEAEPRAGIIQSLPLAANRETLFARALQFAGRLYGPPLAVGHAFWQLGEANYFGHNAIIRTRAFAACCGLPKLPGAPPLGGEILSHDFVEAAFIRRGGWQVRMLPALRGSWEELPSNLIDYAVRDRRWAQGNLQHAAVVGARGLHWIGRLHLAMGILAFLASPLWLLLLLLSSAVVIEQAMTGHSYFLPGYTLFPVWPEYRPVQTYALLAATAVILFLPKLLALLLALGCRDARRAFGGAARLLASAFAELLFSLLLAPVMMLFHSSFVLTVLLGRSVGWKAQPRDDRGVGWRDAARRHAGHGLVGAVWAGTILWLAPDFLPWVAPVVLGMLCAIPLTVVSSRRGAGLAARRLGLFLTPEEVAPPPELQALRDEMARRASPGSPDARGHAATLVSGITRAVAHTHAGSLVLQAAGEQGLADHASAGRPAWIDAGCAMHPAMPPRHPLEMPEQAL